MARRREVVFSFPDGNGPVPAYLHHNGDGSVGGWVAHTVFVSRTAHVGKDARVWGNAQILDHAQVLGYSRVFGHAEISGHAKVLDRAQVYDHAKISGRAEVHDNAEVCGHVEVSDAATVCDEAQVRGSVRVCGTATVSHRAVVEAPEDLRVGENWTAFRVNSDTRAFAYVVGSMREWRFTRAVHSWDELPKALHYEGLIPTMEYLAQTLEQELEQKPESTS